MLLYECNEIILPLVVRRWWRAILRHTVCGSCGARRRNFSCRVSWAAKRVAARSPRQNPWTAPGSVVSTKQKTLWCTTDSRDGTADDRRDDDDHDVDDDCGDDDYGDGDGQHHRHCS